MALTFSSFWRWDGKVTRRTYAMVGAGGLAIKFNLDRVIADYFGFHWNLWNYLDPLEHSGRFLQLSAPQKYFLTILLITALPFLWIGISMTMKRLRDAGQPLALTLLFFAPVVNLLFFAVLCIIPSQLAGTQSGRNGRARHTSTGSPVSGAYNNRNCRAARSCLETPDRISAATPGNGVAIPAGHLLSNRSAYHRRRSDRRPRVPLFHRQLQRTNSRLGTRQALRFLCLRRTTAHERDFALRKHPRSPLGRSRFSAGTCRLCLDRTAERWHPA